MAKLEGREGARQLVCRVCLTVTLMLAVGVPPVFVNHPIAYVPLLTVLLCLALGAVYLLVARRGLQATVAFEAECCPRGGTVDLIVHLKNDTPLLIPRVEPCFYVTDVFGAPDVRAHAATALTRGESSDFHIAVALAHVGTYHAGLEGVRIFDPLGLLSSTVRCAASCVVEAVPRITPACSVEIERAIVRESQRMVRPIAADDIDYAGVRDYVPGDPLKSIHWKLSARSEQYLTRLFETYTNPSVTIVVDAHAPHARSEELMECNDALVEGALSLEACARSQGMDVSLAFVDRNGEEQRVEPSLCPDPLRSLAPLPVASPSVPVDAARSLLRREQGYVGCGTIVYCAAQLDDELVECLMELRSHKKGVTLVMVVPRAQREGVEAAHRYDFSRLDATGVFHCVIASADELARGGAQ